MKEYAAPSHPSRRRTRPNRSGPERTLRCFAVSRLSLARFATRYLLCLLCLIPTVASAKPFLISADGSEVTDLKTGLIWRRCAEGKTWDGTTCAGTAGTFSHEAALQRAAAQAISTGVAWRLPNVKELASIADLSRSNPAIDPAAFPETWANGYWSASPHVSYAIEAWYIHFSYGYAHFDLRARAYQVRLVRTAP